MIVVRHDFGVPGAIGGFQHVLPTIRVVLVGGEQPEVAGLEVEPHHVTEECPHDAGGFGVSAAGGSNFDSIVAKIGQDEILEEDSPVSMWIVPHAPRSSGSRSEEHTYELH